MENARRKLTAWWKTFTLTQALLITATLAVQAAILYPYAIRSQDQARQAQCASNLRAVSLVVNMYTQDYEECLPTSMVVSATRSPTPAEVQQFLTAIPPATPPGAPKVSWAGAMRAYLKIRSAVPYCPTDIEPKTLSYWWRAAVDIAGLAGFNSGGDFEYPASTVILYEHSSWHFGSNRGIRDRSYINVAFLDGHVAMVSVRNGPLDFPSRADEENGAAAMRLGSPMYLNYDPAAGQNHPGLANYTDPRVYADRFW